GQGGDRAEAGRRDAHCDPIAHCTKGMKIIIADDHPLLVDGLRRMLEEMDGMQVLEPVSNGRQLLARLRDQAVDIVLLDLHMPQLDGLETLRVLQRELPAVKILIFTNYNQAKLWREARSLGARG